MNHDITYIIFAKFTVASSKKLSSRGLETWYERSNERSRDHNSLRDLARNFGPITTNNLRPRGKGRKLACQGAWHENTKGAAPLLRQRGQAGLKLGHVGK